MPELFGSAYVLPAIVVIVLLLVLLVAVMMNKQAQARKAASSAGDGTKPVTARETAGRAGHLSLKPRADTKHVVAPPIPVGTDVPSGAGLVPPLEIPEADVSMGTSATQRPEIRKGTRPLGQHAARWEAVRPTPGAVSAADPITPVLAELLRGWGDLSREDRNRLSVFRPEKLQADLQALPVP